MKKNTLILSACLLLPSLFAGCASTKSIELKENSPVAVISVIGTSLVQWQSKEANDTDEDDADGTLTALVNKTIDGKNIEIASATDRLDYADDAFRYIVPEITGIEVLSKDSVVNSDIYKYTRGTLYNALVDSTHATDYKDMSVLGAKKARMIMKEIGAQSLVSLEFNFKKILASGKKKSGEVAALVTMRVKFRNNRGSIIIDKEYSMQSSDTVPIGGSYYDKDELVSLIYKTIDELITQFALDYSSGNVDESSIPEHTFTKEATEAAADSSVKNAAPTRLGKPKSYTAAKASDTAAQEAVTQKAEETARNLLNMGLDTDKIADATGLSVERVQQLKEELSAKE